MFADIKAKLEAGMTWEEIEDEHKRQCTERGEIWFETDEIEELIRSLEHATYLAAKITKDVTWWKWVIIALHNTLQGACVCAISGADTSGVKVLPGSLNKPDSDMSRMLKWISTEEDEQEYPCPQPRLAKTLILYNRVKDPAFLKDPHRLLPGADVDRDVKKLNSLRNEFIHFTPKGWSLEVSGLSRIARSVCDIVEHLAVKHPTFSHHLSKDRQRRLVVGLAELRRQMDEWDVRKKGALY